MSGQLINYHKSTIYFSKCACQRRCRAIAQILDVRLMGKEAKYLGNPLILRKNKNLSFEFLINKIQNRIGTWKTLLIS